MAHYDDVTVSPIHPQLLDTAQSWIATEEDFRAEPYHDSEGYPTVGFGQRIGPQGADILLYQFVLPYYVAQQWLRANINQVAAEIANHPAIKAAFANCNRDRQTMLVSMAYQMGVAGLAGFKNMLAAMAAGDWQAAAAHSLDSRFAKQTPNRAMRQADVIATGWI